MNITELTNGLYEKVSKNTKVADPGIIQEYDYKLKKAKIKLDRKERFSNGSYIDCPIISNVPVIFPFSGGASLTFPVRKGDRCLVIYTDRDLTRWKLGGSNAVPESNRSHHVSDCFAIMGAAPFTVKSPAENNDDVLLIYDGSKVSLKPNGVIDIITGKEVNIKTETITINCKNAVINAEEDVNTNCKNAIIKASENVSIEDKNTTIKASELVNIECKNSSIKASEAVIVECKTATATVAEELKADCNALTLTSKADTKISCVNADINASGNITTKSTEFNHTGNFKVTGSVIFENTLEIQGATTMQASLTVNDNITSTEDVTAGGKSLKTHTHGYTEPVAGSNPTAVTPNVPTSAPI